jgi:hypothetical protein
LPFRKGWKSGWNDDAPEMRMDPVLEIRNLSCSFGPKPVFQEAGLCLKSLTARLNSPEGELFTILKEAAANAAKISRELPAVVQQVDGRIREIQGILGDIKKATAEGPAIAANVKEISREMREITGDVKRTIPELPELVHQTRETVEDADQVITGLRNHRLIRGWVSPSRQDSPVEISQRQSPYEKKGDAPR